MTVLSYLKSIADSAVLSAAEKESIDRSEKALRQKLSAHFGSQIKDQFRFGSYDRGTMLPRSMDELSDVDYMIVFEDGGFRPQTYLDRLRRFVDEKYSRSDVSQSHPTIQLSLEHIRFEIVPATRIFIYGLNIPQRDGTGQNWMHTDPKDANARLVEKNSGHSFLIKPLVRLVKYWNACNGYPFESFDLERQIVDYPFGTFGFNKPKDLQAYFFEFMRSLPELWIADWKAEKVQRAKEIIGKISSYEELGQWSLAEQAIKKLLPELIKDRKTLLG